MTDVEQLAGPPPLPPGRPVTSAGLPYPTPQDAVTDIDLYIKELAAATEYRLSNRAILVSRQVLVTNANGDLTVTFPGFTAVQGVVLAPFANTAAGGSPWTLYPTITALVGNSAAARVYYAQQKEAGTAILPFASAAYDYSIYAWGVPV